MVKIATGFDLDELNATRPSLPSDILNRSLLRRCAEKNISLVAAVLVLD